MPVIINALFVGILLLLVNPAFAEQDLRLSYFMGSKHPMNNGVFQPFANKLSAVSGGKLHIKQYPGGALNSSPPRQYSILLDGVADIAFAVPGYTAQLFPVTTVVAVPTLVSTAIEGTEALWRAYELIEEEYDAKILAIWTNGPSVLVTRDKPVHSLSDLKGMKIRVSSKTEVPYIKALGASPVSQPVSVINQNLQNGTIDAVAIDPGGIISFKLWESAKFVTIGLPSSCSAFVLLMNREVWEGLTPQEKAWIDEASGEWLSLRGANTYHKAGMKALELIREKGVEIISLDAKAKVEFKQIIQRELHSNRNSKVTNDRTQAEVIKVMTGE